MSASGSGEVSDRPWYGESLLDLILPCYACGGSLPMVLYGLPTKEAIEGAREGRWRLGGRCSTPYEEPICHACGNRA